MTHRPDTPPLIHIFIGSPVENQSERDCFRTIYEALAKMHSWAYIFANFNAAGRQIDLTVFTEKTTLVIEAKGYSLPVRGGMNGQWEQRGPYGAKNIRNGYIQALDAKNALRDVIQRINPVDGYPNGLVAVTPVVPKDSDLTSGDFKVGVTGLEMTAEILNRPSGALLTQDQCKALASQLGLEAVTSTDAILNDEVLVAERQYDTYRKAFCDFYRPMTVDLVSDQYKCGDLETGPTEVRSMVTDGASGVLIHGPSGCGKTLLSTSCAISCVSSGCIPIFVSAKNFDGEFQRLLNREAALLSVPLASIINAGRLLGKRIILFLDGYNECRDDLKVSLTRSLKAFALRYDAGIVVSTQQDLVRSEILTMSSVIVKRPSDDLKASLARIKDRGDHAENLRSLLQVASSGLEAGLVGEVGASLPMGASRFALFDTYARKKLGSATAEGIQILSSFAEMLVHRACFSISVREFDRLVDSTNLNHAARQQLLRSQLLQVRGDRISFIHELFFSAFSAEAAIRSTKGDLTSICDALGAPRFFSSKAFILGAIEDDRVVCEVLERITDQDLLADCFRGECGSAAQSVVKRKIESMLKVMIAEAQGLTFQLDGEGWDSISVNISSLRHELKDFASYLPAIGQGLMDGQYLDAVMAACQYMDGTIETFSHTGATEAKAKKIPLRHAVFSTAYVMDPKAAISQLINFIHSGGLSIRRQEGNGFCAALREAWTSAVTPSQFYFLIGLTKFSVHNKEAAQYLVQLLQDIRTYPYHLQLDLIDFTGYLRDVDEPYRTGIIETLQVSLDKLGVMMNSIIIEALQRLGALEEAEQSHIPIIRREIQDVLSTDGNESDLAAWLLFSCQFDHPFDSAYWEEIQELDDSRKKLLLTKACRGANASYTMFLGILIRQLSRFNDPSVASAITQWTALPDKQSCIPQDAVEVFRSAHEALGHLRAELPQLRNNPTTVAEIALLACGELYYWASRTDVEGAERLICTGEAQTILLDHSKCASAGVLYLTSSSMMLDDEMHISLVKEYPNLCVAICREALKRRNEQVSYFEKGFHDNTDNIACFTIKVLGEAGNIDDLQTLRDLCDHERFGISSLEAIKKIEERTHFRHD